MVLVRALTERDDLLQVGRVLVESWRHSYRGVVDQRYLDRLAPERWIPALRADTDRTLILYSGERVEGVAMVGFSRSRVGCGELFSLYLRPEAMGRGYGRVLLQHAIDRIRAEGCTQICLWVMEPCTASIGFYRHMGFAATGRTQMETYGASSVSLIEMIRDL